jgi:hypothetical protein
MGKFEFHDVNAITETVTTTVFIVTCLSEFIFRKKKLL